MQSPSTDNVLELERYGVAFDRSEVFHSIDLVLGRHGAVAVMGPGGAGKSSLLRTLAGWNEAQPTLRCWGTARYCGMPLGVHARPAIVAQSARLLMADAFENVAIGLAARSDMTRREQRTSIDAAFDRLGVTPLADRLAERVVDLTLAEQRMLAIVRAFVSDAPLVLVDEPTVGLDDVGRTAVLGLLRTIASLRALLWVTHDQHAARAVGGRIALLVDGRIAEEATTEEFLGAPRSPEAQRFVQTGTCYAIPVSDSPPPGPDQRTTRPPGPLSFLLGARIPRGLVWVHPKRLAGMPRPGLLEDVEVDVVGLSSLGVNLLVCLEEQQTVSVELLARHGIASSWVPIDDMKAPSVETAVRLCVRVGAALEAGGVVAMHCRAGLGRTGTMLAAFLIWQGSTPLEALERVRSLQPRFVQSEAQVAFLDELGCAVARARPVAPTPLAAPRSGGAVRTTRPS